MPPKAPASRKSTGAIATTTIKRRTTDRRKSAPAPAILTDQDYDVDMPPPSSQRSEGDSQERLKTAAKSAKDNFRATADRCAIIRESIEQAEEDIAAVNVQLMQNSAKKEATFLKALQAHLDAISSNPTKQPQPSTTTSSSSSSTHPKAATTSTTTRLLSLCASLTAHYQTTTSTLTSSQARLQTHLEIGATWTEDQAVLIDTLKGGARVVDRRIKSLTNEEVDGVGMTADEDRVMRLLGLNEAMGMGDANVHAVMTDARSGLRRMTRGLPENVGEDVDMVM